MSETNLNTKQHIITHIKGHFTTIVILVTSILYFGYVSYFLDHGLDFTDEGFYINWISNPFNFTKTGTIFGFIFHPFYKIVGDNIYTLRLLGVYGVATLSFFIFYLYLKDLISSTFEKASYSLALSTISLMAIRTWLLTPSYNTLTMLGILGYFLSTLIIKKCQPATIISSTLIAFFGVITFCGKPTSAALIALHCAVFFFLFFKDKKKFLSHFFTSLGTSLVFLIGIALYSTGSIENFYLILKNGLEISGLMESGHGFQDIIRIDRIPLFKKSLWVFAYYLLIALAVNKYSSKDNRNYYALLFFIPLLVLAIWSFFPGQIDNLRKIVPGLESRTFPVLFLSLSFFLSLTLLSKIFFQNCTSKDIVLKINKNLIGPFLAHYFFVYAYSFGTGSNYWRHGYAFSIFFILPILKILSSGLPEYSIIDKKLATRILAFTVLITSILIVNTGMTEPYRQIGDIRTYNDIIKINKSSLYVSKDFSRYINELQQLTNQNEFSKSHGFLDLTGHYPLVAYITNSKPIGAPWILGGYKGSNLVAKTLLQRSNKKDLENFWLLIEQDGRRSINHSVLEGIGLQLKDDFELIQVIKAPHDKTNHYVYLKKN